MIEPSIDKLLERVDSKYTLVVLAAKRSRELVSQTPADSVKTIKPVTISLHEIANGIITYERIKPSIK